MKTYRNATALQIIYCSGCFAAIVCLWLYTAFYPSEFGSLCFIAGALLTLLSVFNPMGIIASIVNCVVCFSACFPKSKRSLIGVITGPLFAILAWIVTVSSFISLGGGV